MESRYRNRSDAGEILASHLTHLTCLPDLLTLGLPRGGVPVAYPVAQALRTPLDIFIVRKLGVPDYAELAMGAVASGGVRFLNEDLIRRLRITPRMVESVTQRESAELDRRSREYRCGRASLNLCGRPLLLIDDGLATGSTMRAAVLALKKLAPARIVVAVPVGARETCQSLATEVDELICPLQPLHFAAVGSWYDDFSQTSAAEVCALLDRTNPSDERKNA